MKDRRFGSSLKPKLGSAYIQSRPAPAKTPKVGRLQHLSPQVTPCQGTRIGRVLLVPLGAHRNSASLGLPARFLRNHIHISPRSGDDLDSRFHMSAGEG